MEDLDMTLEEIVEELFYDGWRARQWTEFKAFEKPGTDIWNEIDEEVERSTWEALRKFEISATWKERHAKGVPVKMTQGEWIDKCRGQYQQYPRFSDYPPTIASRGKVWTTAFDPIKGDVASFCNFRYKPEWMEKHKKQTI